MFFIKVHIHGSKIVNGGNVEDETSASAGLNWWALRTKMDFPSARISSSGVYCCSSI